MGQRNADGDIERSAANTAGTADDSAVTPAERESLASAAAEGDVDRLERIAAEKAEEAQRNYDMFLRERAEVENFKKRMVREGAESVRFAVEPLVRDLLPVVDNLERALEHAEDSSQSVIEGVRLVLSTLLDVLERHGVKRVDATGAQFDPAVHEAMAGVESAEHEPNQVVQQHQIGYQLHDRLLRPALVTVNTRKIDAAVESGDNSD